MTRWERQTRLPEIGLEGQDRLAQGKVLVVGAGGLGSAVAYYLAAAGVGRLGLVDDDWVEPSNLNRQILHRPDRIGRLKVASAGETLTDFYPEIKIETYPVRLESSRHARSIIARYDLVVDCLDNVATRFLINDLCQELAKPWVYGAVSGFEGQMMTILPGGPCYRCLYPEPAPSSRLLDTEGVIGVAPGAVGVMQAAEAIKLLLGQGRLLTGRLLFMDLFTQSFSEMKITANPVCPSCFPFRG